MDVVLEKEAVQDENVEGRAGFEPAFSRLTDERFSRLSYQP